MILIALFLNILQKGKKKLSTVFAMLEILNSSIFLVFQRQRLQKE